MRRFSYSAVSVGGEKHDDEGDILLRSISAEDAEYGGSLDDVSKHDMAVPLILRVMLLYTITGGHS